VEFQEMTFERDVHCGVDGFDVPTWLNVPVDARQA
jgi:hypothetical protein